MVFNVVYANFDDHMKNHFFIYDEQRDAWNLAPAYDLTYLLNPMINVVRNNRALSINNKRTDVGLSDLLSIAEKFTIRNPKRIIEEVQSVVAFWEGQLYEQGLPEDVASKIVVSRQSFKL